MSSQNWEHFFKPEVRSAGQALFAKGVVASSQPSDTEIKAYIRASTSFQVSFKSPSIDSSLVIVDCNCPPARKGQLCKHVWATLLKIEASHPDFLDSKTEIEKRSIDSPGPAAVKARPEARPFSEAQLQSRATFKAKQDAYRKEQSEKQKKRLKEQKLAKKGTSRITIPERPAEVEEALAYFSLNGFPMASPLDPENLRGAKKKLSRVFHPDIGGSHQEIIELNENFQILIDYIEMSGAR